MVDINKQVMFNEANNRCIMKQIDRIVNTQNEIVYTQKKQEEDHEIFNAHVDKIFKDVLEKIDADKKKQEEDHEIFNAHVDKIFKDVLEKIDADKKKQEEDHEIFKRITTIIFLCFILIYMFYYNSISKNDYDSVSILNLT
jgi:ribosome assembly protein YihI (activator of Der GTPase)